jgi:hypothetical protein
MLKTEHRINNNFIQNWSVFKLDLEEIEICLNLHK